MYLEVTLWEVDIYIEFLVVKSLTVGVILGFDILDKIEMTTPILENDNYVLNMKGTLGGCTFKRDNKIN